MRYKQLSIRLPIASYNKIQRQALVENVSMNNVFNAVLDEHIKNEDVIQELRRTTDVIADILLLAFNKEENLNKAKNLKSKIQEGKNGS